MFIFFGIDELCQAMLLAGFRAGTAAMLIHAGGKIGRNTDVKRSEWGIRHDVHPAALHDWSMPRPPLGCQPTLA
jgi:hypothetical protein